MLSDLSTATVCGSSPNVDALEEWGNTTEQVKIDSAGRLTLPLKWAKEVGLDVKQNAVLLGAIVNFKIWNETQYDTVAAERRVRGKTLLEKYDG